MDVTKNLLLPHKCQVIGCWLLVAAAIEAVAFIASDLYNIIHNPPTLIALAQAYLGLLLVCLSREKVDDEYISSIRGRIIFILVTVAIIAKIFTMTVIVINVYPSLSMPIAGYLGCISFLYHPLILMVIYIISLKLTLFIQNRRISRYAEQ